MILVMPDERLVFVFYTGMIAPFRPQFLCNPFDFGQVLVHLTPSVPKGIIRIHVKGTLECAHPMLEEQFLRAYGNPL